MRTQGLLCVLLLGSLSLTDGFTLERSSMGNSRIGSGVSSASRIAVALHEKPSSPATESSDSSVISDDTDSREATPLPPVLQQITDERAEFQVNLGKAMDTIRKDMPDILHRRPDFEIYDEDITVIDPSGLRLEGLTKYKSAIRFLQTFIGFWFSIERSSLQYRMVYDFCRSSIQVSWNVELMPKFSLGNSPVYVDGMSYYRLDVSSGKIIEHKLDNVVINRDNAMLPPYGIWSLMQQNDLFGTESSKQRVPVGVAGAATMLR